MAIGLSLSNESVQSSYFIASHLLQRCKSFTRWNAWGFLTRIQLDIACGNPLSSRDLYGFCLV
jgi:hypothetical protein